MKWGQAMPRTLEDEGRNQEGNFSGSMRVLLPGLQSPAPSISRMIDSLVTVFSSITQD